MIQNPIIPVSQRVLLGAILAIFAYLGFKRGINRELVLTLGIVLGILLSSGLATFLTPWVNRFYRLGRFALSGGLFSDNPATAWQETSQFGELVKTPENQRVLALLIFLIFALAFYLIGQRKVPVAKTLILKGLGFLAGAVNGFLVAYYLSPYFLTVPVTTITLPSQELRKTLTATDSIALVLFIFVAIMIAFGLYSARGSGRK